MTSRGQPTPNDRFLQYVQEVGREDALATAVDRILDFSFSTTTYKVFVLGNRFVYRSRGAKIWSIDDLEILMARAYFGSRGWTDGTSSIIMIDTYCMPIPFTRILVAAIRILHDHFKILLKITHIRVFFRARGRADIRLLLERSMRIF